MNKDKSAPEGQAENTEEALADEPELMENGEESFVAEPNGEQNGNGTDDAQQQIAELKDKYIRMYAEFDNYKRRAVREKLDWMKSAAQDTLSALLPVLDDFDRARKFAGPGKDSGLSEGVELVYQKLYNILRQKGLEAMESTGEAFDPDIHDAITEIPAPTEYLRGKVIDTIEKGYRLHDKIIRHAKVVVGK